MGFFFFTGKRSINIPWRHYIHIGIGVVESFIQYIPSRQKRRTDLPKKLVARIKEYQSNQWKYHRIEKPESYVSKRVDIEFLSPFFFLIYFFRPFFRLA